jgi:hypothetical protein
MCPSQGPMWIDAEPPEPPVPVPAPPEPPTPLELLEPPTPTRPPMPKPPELELLPEPPEPPSGGMQLVNFAEFGPIRRNLRIQEMCRVDAVSLGNSAE